MSELVKLKGHILPYLPKDASIREAIIDCFNAIDNDLDENGYEPSSDTEEAIERLDSAYVEDALEESEKLDLLSDESEDEDEEVDTGAKVFHDEDDEDDEDDNDDED